jgi:superfamily II DNA or RNA helicase
VHLSQGNRSTLVVLPTGAGKTVVIAEIARAVVARGGRVLVIAHRRELLTQSIAKLAQAIPDVVIALEQGGNRAEAEARVIVGSVQTLSRGSRLGRFPRDAFRLIVIDEAHHAAAASYGRVLSHFKTARVVGFTATPDRGDGKSIVGTVFDSVAYERSMLDLIRDGYLAPVRAQVVRVDAFDLEGARITGGDIDEGDIASALGRDGVLETIAELLVTHAGERSTLVFVAGVERAHALAALLEPQGGALAVDGKTHPDARAQRFAAFADGSVRFLVNVGIATEGTDLPRCSCVAIVRPTMSRPLFVQMVGRGTRLHPDKAECLLLNLVPANTRHRLVAPIDAFVGPASEAAEHARGLAERAPDEPLHLVAEQAEREAPDQRKAARLATYSALVEEYDVFGLIAGFLDLSLAERLDAAGNVDPDARSKLTSLGVPSDVARALPRGLAGACRVAILARHRAGLCSLKVARQLQRRGLNPNVSRELGSLAMEALAANKWRGTPQSLLTDSRFALEVSDAA